MKGKFTERFVIVTFISLLTLCIISFFKTQIAYSATTHLVISEVQIAGSGGANEDFVEIYNPTTSSVDLNGYRLVKRTESGTSDSSIKAWSSETIIPAGGHYLWANSSWAPSVTPDTTTSSTLAANNGVALRQGPMDTGTIIDSVAWGTAANAFVENTPFPTNPGADESLERSGDDTNNNSVDFFLQVSPNPQNSGTTPTETVTPIPTETTSPTPTPTTEPTTSGEVVINEVAWMGTVASADDEWIELYNNSSSSVDLTDWTLVATDGTPDVTLSGTVAANGYFLLERSDDDTVKDIAADQIYSGALGNTGETLELRDSGNNLVDAVNSDGGGWPEGDSSTRTSMERVDPTQAGHDDNWATNDGITINGTDAADNNILGTPKNQNSTQGVGPSPTPTETVAPTPTEIPSPSPTETLTPTPTEVPTATPTESPTPTETTTPTPITQPSPTPTQTPSPTSTPTVQPTPTPSPTPTLPGKVVGRFWFPNKTVTCRLTFRVKVHKFFIMLIPKVTCK